jgi:hypothetical protein
MVKTPLWSASQDMPMVRASSPAARFPGGGMGSAWEAAREPQERVSRHRPAPAIAGAATADGRIGGGMY